MNPIYRFFLQIGREGEKHVVHPTYKDDLTLDYALESSQKFYRAKLSGKIDFIRNDYDLINNAPFDSEFFFYIEKSDDWGQTYSQYYKAIFMKTDCTINDDDKSISVQPDTYDEYYDVLAGIEKEYNLINLAPEINFVTIRKRPLIQIYVPGDSIVSCFLGGGTTWEQDATSTESQLELTRSYHFSLCNILKEINVTSNGTPADIAGLYSGKMTFESNTGKYKGNMYRLDSNTYYIYYEQEMHQSIPVGSVHVEIRRSSDNQPLFFFDKLAQGAFDNEEYDFTPVGGSGSTGSMHAEMATYNIYARLLCDVESIGGVDTYTIPTEDIVDNNRNYRRVIGYSIDSAFISNVFSDEPTEYGRADSGKYFAPPYSLIGSKFYPIARSTWRYASIWFAFNLFDWILDEEGRKEYTLRDAYTLSSCINVLLKQFAPGITHEATTEYSRFLYSSVNPISSQSFKLLITQKSNITNGEYQTPAQKAPITLKQIMNMLRDVYKCYWYIEDGKFKIEQINFFRNGGSYSQSPVIGYDLTELSNTRNGKKLAFATSEYSFDKVDMPERYQFEWMDDVTTSFQGLPIEVESKYVTAGKIEEINISNFTTDIDFMLLNPSAISQDGFALFAAVTPQGGGQLELPFTRQTVDGVEYYIQNGYLAYINLQPTYWVYDMPARLFKINDTEYQAASIERKKKQTLNFPCGADDPNPMHLIKTYIGNGQIEKISVNLCSRNIKAELKYDTE
jgi:hypothetical protein